MRDLLGEFTAELSARRFSRLAVSIFAVFYEAFLRFHERLCLSRQSRMREACKICVLASPATQKLSEVSTVRELPGDTNNAELNSHD